MGNGGDCVLLDGGHVVLAVLEDRYYGDRGVAET